MPETEQDTKPLFNEDAIRAADKISAAVVVLEAVQEMRYDDRQPHLRECMRQTALAALGDAQRDAQSAWSACHK